MLLNFQRKDRHVHHDKFDHELLYRLDGTYIEKQQRLLVCIGIAARSSIMNFNGLQASLGRYGRA